MKRRKREKGNPLNFSLRSREEKLHLLLLARSLTRSSSVFLNFLSCKNFVSQVHDMEEGQGEKCTSVPASSHYMYAEKKVSPCQRGWIQKTFKGRCSHKKHTIVSPIILSLSFPSQVSGGFFFGCLEFLQVTVVDGDDKRRRKNSCSNSKSSS